MENLIFPIVLYTKEVRTHHHYTRMYYHFIPVFKDIAPLDPAPETLIMASSFYNKREL
jgi:hypothetical protein